MSSSRPMARQRPISVAEILDAFEDPAALIGAGGEILDHNQAWQVHRFSDPAFSDGDPIPVARVLAGEIDHFAAVGRRVSRDGWRWYRSRVRAIAGTSRWRCSPTATSPTNAGSMPGCRVRPSPTSSSTRTAPS